MKGTLPDRERVSFNVARMKKEGKTFEVVIDPDKAILFKQGSLTDVHEALHAEKIFDDAHKGQISAPSELVNAFGTDDPLNIAAIIIKEGMIQVTSEYREKKREEKKRRILELIRVNAVDPKSGLPHPPQRIENAFDEARVHIDENKTAEDQIKDVLDALRPILPIKFDVKVVKVHIPANYAAKMYSTVKQFGKIMHDEWLNDGSWMAEVEIPAGLQTDFYDEINAKTHGNVEIR